MPEIWKPVVGYEGWYEVSNHGRVRSVDRWIDFSDGRQLFYHGQVLKLRKHNLGYATILLKQNQKEKRFYVHRLVGKTFVDPTWKGEFDHKDRNKDNNLVSNVRVATGSQNTANRTKTLGVSKYKGVGPKKNKRYPWRARITVQTKEIYLGAFSTQEEAARAYNKAAVIHFGDFACLNEVHS